MSIHFHQNTSLAQQLLFLQQICKTDQKTLIVVDNQFLQHKILEILDFKHDFYIFVNYISVILNAIDEDFSKETLLPLLKLIKSEFQLFHIEQKIIRTVEYNGGLENLQLIIDKEPDFNDFNEIYEKILDIKNEISELKNATFAEFCIKYSKVIHNLCGKLLKFDNFCGQNEEKISLYEYKKRLKQIIFPFKQQNFTISNKIDGQKYELIVFFNVRNLQFCNQEIFYVKNVFNFTTQNLEKFLLQNLLQNTGQSMVFFQDFTDLPLFFKEKYYSESVEKNEKQITCKTFEKIEKKFDFNLILQQKNSFYVDEFVFAIKNPHTFWYSRILKFKKAKKITKKPQMRDLQRLFLEKITGNSPQFFEQYPELMYIWEKKLENLQKEFHNWKKETTLYKAEKFTRTTHVNDVQITFKFQPDFADDEKSHFFDVRILEEQRQHVQIITHLTQKEDLYFQTVQF